MNYKLRVCWLYPELMSTYGDRGNVFVLSKRCQWRDIKVEITTEIKGADIVLGGGAQDRQQSIVINELQKQKTLLKSMFDFGVPGLFVCGSPQLLGHYYEMADKTKIEGLGIFDMVTKTGFGKSRLIGNLVFRLCHPEFISGSNTGMLKSPPWRDLASAGQVQHDTVVGFENHSGRTYLGKIDPFGKVLSGFGNNGEDKTEGAIYKNCLATYSHGPLLSKNPHVADWLIKKALEVKYQKEVELEPLDDTLEWSAHNFILQKYGR